MERSTEETSRSSDESARRTTSPVNSRGRRMPGERPAADTVAAIASRTSTWLQDSRRRRRAWRGGCQGEAWRKTGRRGGAEGNTGRPGGRPDPARGALGTRAGGRGRTDERAETRAQSMRGETDATSASERARACLAAALALGGMPPLRRRLATAPARCHRASGKFFRTKSLGAAVHHHSRWAPEPHHAFENLPRHHGQSGRLEDTHHFRTPRLSARSSTSRCAGVARRPCPRLDVVFRRSPTPRRRFADPRPSPVSKMDFTCSERVADAHWEIRYIVDMTATRHVLEVRVPPSE